jgi:hypothetical protein
MADREQFERRLLALVRDYLNETDEEFPEGYEIEDFIVLYQVRFAPPEDQDLQPWHGGPNPGWWLGVSFSTTTGSHWHDEALLAEALQRVRDRRSDLRSENRDPDQGEPEDS